MLKRRVVLFLALVLSSSAGFAASERLTVLVYNVGLLRFPLMGDLVPEVRTRARLLPQEIAALVEKEQVDVFLGLEAWDQAHVAAIGAALNSRGSAFEIIRPDQWLLKQGAFLAIRRERLSLENWRFADFPRELRAGLEKLIRKGVLGATVTIRGSHLPALELVGSHHQALTLDAEDPKKQAEYGALLQQLEMVATLVEKWTDQRARPALVFGDYNVGPGLGENLYYSFIDRLRLDNLFLRANSRSPEVTWDRANPLVQRGGYAGDPSALVDHCFAAIAENAFIRPVEGRIVFKENLPGQDFPGSDHYGLLLKLEIQDGPLRL